MSAISGNIGQIVPFNVTQAGAITGVYFGSGLSQNAKAQSNNTTILAKVPEDANWDYVTFKKTPETRTHNIDATGYKQTGAFSNLNAEVVASGFSNSCTSGAVSYSNAVSAVTICNLNATGSSEALASGRLYDAYVSGLCGDDGSYTDSGYTSASTRVSDYAAFEDDSGDWLAIGTIEDTGNFTNQKASVAVTCSTPRSEATSYKFVPIPLITSFSPAEGEQGDPLNIYGYALHDVSNISINDSGVTFQRVSNTRLSGSVPAGVFNHKVKVVGPSGVTSESVENYKSLSNIAPSAATLSLSILPNQFLVRKKGSTESMSVIGSNITGLSSATLTDQGGTSVNLLSDSSFSHTNTVLSIPASGLNQGVYDLSIQGTRGSASASDIISIIDSPVINQSTVPIFSSVLINEPTTYDTQDALETAKYNSQYSFTTTEKPDKICLSMRNSGITSGSTTFKLGYEYDNSFNSTDYYYIKATGQTIVKSAKLADSMFNSGIYTTDEYGDSYDAFSYALQPCLCTITNSGNTYISSTSSFYRSGMMTGLIAGETGNHPSIVPIKDLCISDFNAYANERPYLSCAQSGFLYSTEVLSSSSFPTIYLSGTGYSNAISSGSVTQQLNSHPGYIITNWNHGYVNIREANTYKSGINYPYPTASFADYTLPAWENIRLSGMNDLYPNGYPGGDNLTTSYAHTNSNNYQFNNKISGVAGTEAQAILQIESQKDTSYSQCLTGNYVLSSTTINTTLNLTGTTYGYC